MNKKIAWPLLAMAISTGASVVWAIETRPDFGPWLADNVRNIVGAEWVARGEEVYYAIEDQINLLRYKNAEPVAMWKQPSSTENAVKTKITPAVDTHFVPASFAPPVPAVAAANDGVWEAWNAGPQGTAGLLYRTQVHTDALRPQSVVALVAMDLTRLELHTVPGTHEPQSNALSLSQRTGLVPEADRQGLVAAFNGGWQAIHGHLGMKVGNVELLPPVQWGCGIATREDGSVRIASWPVLKPEYNSLRWMRQTPPCLLENGREDARLANENQRWGAALNGETVVRRSAIGLNADGTVLYYAVGDALTSAAIAKALKVAGATSAAMLDINHAFPRFVTFRSDNSHQGWQDHLPAEPSPPADIYVQTPANKDFFYLRMRQQSAAWMSHNGSVMGVKQGS